MKKRVVRISGKHYQSLREHLFPGDGCEAVALALCGRLETATTQGLMVHKLLLIPHDQCHERTPMRVSWSAAVGMDLYEEAMAKKMAILKIHSHPTDYADFSETDDYSDTELFSSLHGWTDDGLPHASAVMMQGGDMIARFVTADLKFEPVDCVTVAGSDLTFFRRTLKGSKFAEAQLRTAQAFGDKTVKQLASLTVGVVGTSGTGSWIIEQLSRLGVGKLVLVDPDEMEDKNLNRIINSRASDSALSMPTRFITDLQHFQPSPVIIDQTQQPVVTVVHDLSLGIPFRHELAAVFSSKRLSLVLTDAGSIEQLAVQVFLFQPIPVNQGHFRGIAQQTEGRDDG